MVPLLPRVSIYTVSPTLNSSGRSRLASSLFFGILIPLTRPRTLLIWALSPSLSIWDAVFFRSLMMFSDCTRRFLLMLSASSLVLSRIFLRFSKRMSLSCFRSFLSSSASFTMDDRRIFSFSTFCICWFRLAITDSIL